MTAIEDDLTQGPGGEVETAEDAIYADLCASCSSPVLTFANLQVARDEKHLVRRWMPPGGCTCTSLVEDPGCPLCFPVVEFICKPCGDAGGPS